MQTKTAVLIIGSALRRQTLPIVRPIERLAARAREAGAHVVYANDNFGHWSGGIDAVIEHARLAHRDNARILRALSPQPSDYVVLKPAHSAFYQSPLEHLLQQLGVRRLVLTGVAGDQCVLATASDALLRGFEVVIPSNTLACPTASRTQAIRRHFRIAMDIPTPIDTGVRFANKSRRPPHVRQPQRR